MSSPRWFLQSNLIQACKISCFLLGSSSSNSLPWVKAIKTSGSEMATVFGNSSKSWVNNVDPQRPVLDKMTSLPLGSPISSANRRNDSIGIRINSEHNLNWLMYIKGPVVCFKTSLLGPWTTAKTAKWESRLSRVTLGANTASGWVYLTCLKKTNVWIFNFQFSRQKYKGT